MCRIFGLSAASRTSLQFLTALNRISCNGKGDRPMGAKREGKTCECMLVGTHLTGRTQISTKLVCASATTIVAMIHGCCKGFTYTSQGEDAHPHTGMFAS